MSQVWAFLLGTWEMAYLAVLIGLFKNFDITKEIRDYIEGVCVVCVLTAWFVSLRCLVTTRSTSKCDSTY